MEKKIEETLLRLNLQHFAEVEGADSSDGTENTEEQTPDQAEHMIPKQLDAYEAAKQESDRKSQEEAGEYQTLYETTSKEFGEVKGKFEAIETYNKELEGVIEGLLATKMQSIPKDFHELIPENLTIAQKLAWVDKAEQKGMFGGSKVEEPIGGSTNPKVKTQIDDSSMSSLQRMAFSYATKNK